MALTINAIGTLNLLNFISRTVAAQQATFTRLSTGWRINRGADDPAGLMALGALDAEIASVNAAIGNNQRTAALLDVADGALGEVASLLADIQELATEAANSSGLSADELAANQAQIDDALDAIDRIVAATSFNGRRLLDGSLAIYASVATPGALTDVKVYSRPSGSGDTTLNVKHVSAASAAGVSGVVAAGGLTEDSTFSVAGALGTVVIEAGSGDTVSSIAARINAARGETGLSADAGGAGGSLRIFSVELGSAAFVRTRLIDGDGTAIRDLSDEGVDAGVTVGGQPAATAGNHVTYSGGGVSLAFEIGSLAVGADVDLTIRGRGSAGGSGATFCLGTDPDDRATIGIEGVSTWELGTAAGGYLASLRSGGTNSLLADPARAAAIARTALGQVAVARGRIGGFQRFQVESAGNLLGHIREGLETARSLIRDVDYAAESSELSRQSVLMQTALALLGLANQNSAQVLALLQ